MKRKPSKLSGEATALLIAGIVAVVNAIVTVAVALITHFNQR